MGREIRRVPPGWEHPRDERGHYQPLFDKDYQTAADEWVRRFQDWEANGEQRREANASCDSKIRYYWDWDGGPPDKEYFRPAWTEEPTCYQVYETVSEGTPVSPVFSTLADLRDWLVAQGYSRPAAEAFAATGWAPSMMVIPGKGIYQDIESLAALPQRSQPGGE